MRYRNVYAGVDVVYYGNPRELEFDFVLAPGADPRRIQIELSNPHLPVLSYATLFGGGGFDEGRAIVVGLQEQRRWPDLDHH